MDISKINKRISIVAMKAILVLLVLSVFIFSIPIATATAGIQNVNTSFTVNCIPGSAQTTIQLSFDYQRGAMEFEELNWEVRFFEEDLGADEPMALYWGTFKSIADGGNWIEHESITYYFDACPWIIGDPGDCIEVYATIDVDGHEAGVVHHLEPNIGDICCGKCEEEPPPVPEFPLGVEAAGAIGLMVGVVYIWLRKRKTKPTVAKRFTTKTPNLDSCTFNSIFLH